MRVDPLYVLAATLYALVALQWSTYLRARRAALEEPPLPEFESKKEGEDARLVARAYHVSLASAPLDSVVRTLVLVPDAEAAALVGEVSRALQAPGRVPVVHLAGRSYVPLTAAGSRMELSHFEEGVARNDVSRPAPGPGPAAVILSTHARDCLGDSRAA